MTSFFVHNGKKSVIDVSDRRRVFYIRWNAVEGDGGFTTDTEKEEEPTREQKRKALNDSNNTKNKENGYLETIFRQSFKSAGHVIDAVHA